MEQTDKIDFQKALQKLITDKCEKCKVRIKHEDRKWCERCIAISRRGNRVKPAGVIKDVPHDYIAASIDDFPSLKNDLITYSDSNLYLFGNAGTGKTRAIFAMLKVALLTGYSAERFEMSSLCSRIRDTYNNPTYETENQIISSISDLDILFLDDLGLSSEVTKFGYEVLYRIIDARIMQNLPTTIASNKTIEDICLIYDERIASRLRLFDVIRFKGKDRRKDKLNRKQR